MPEDVRTILGKIHEEVLARYYGCGLVAPRALEGARVLDLGCGAGRDVYVLSAMVGDRGRVVGVDMTEAQLEIARRYRDHHAEAFGLRAPNTEFHLGNIEDLDALGFPPGSFDVVVSNCVLNLALDKGAVLAAVHRLLRPGGEMYFSDVYADRRVPEALRADPVLYGECLSGALYWNDFENLARASGFGDPRLVEDRPLSISNPELEKKLAGIRFFSATYRLFRIDGLEPACEDYGQAVIYRGGIEGEEACFRLDKHHLIEAGRVFPVCGNTWRMLAESRFAPWFEFIGSGERHFGIFSGCGAAIPFDVPEGGEGSGGATGCGC